MARLIFITIMSLFIGSITLGLAGCVTDDSYNSSHRGDGSGETWQDRALKSKGGNHYNSDPATEVLSGGFTG